MMDRRFSRACYVRLQENGAAKEELTLKTGAGSSSRTSWWRISFSGFGDLFL